MADETTDGTAGPRTKREIAVQLALTKLDRLSGGELNGGLRVQAKETLELLWENGRTYGQWEPAPEPQVLRGAHSRPAQEDDEFEEVKPEPRKHDHAFGEESPRIGGCIACNLNRGQDDRPKPDAWQEISEWWETTAHDEIAQLVSKAREYGGAHRAEDLTDLGRSLVEAGVKYGPVIARIDGKPVYGTMTDAEAQELGCYFYLRGKFARWVAAIKEGRPVSDDTLHDIGVYVRMVQRIRAVGGWPV